jgi:hypothetical protein
MSWQMTLDLFTALFSALKESLAHWTPKALTRLDEVFPNDDHKNRSAWRAYLSHARYILESDLINNELPQREGLLWKYSRCLYSDGRYTEAEGPISEVTERRKRVLGAEHPSTLTGMDNLAATYSNQGRSKEAEELEVQVMETSSRGTESPRIVILENAVYLTDVVQSSSSGASPEAGTLYV